MPPQKNTRILGTIMKKKVNCVHTLGGKQKKRKERCLKNLANLQPKQVVSLAWVRQHGVGVFSMAAFDCNELNVQKSHD